LLLAIIHNNASCSEKVHPLFSSHIKLHRHICLELFWTVFTCLIYAHFSPDPHETLHWRKQYYGYYGAILWISILAKSNGLNLKSSWWICSLQTRLLHKTLTDGLELCWLLVICLGSHFDGTHSLQIIHWWASDAKFLNLFWWRNKLIYTMDGLRIHF